MQIPHIDTLVNNYVHIFFIAIGWTVIKIITEQYSVVANVADGHIIYSDIV